VRHNEERANQTAEEGASTGREVQVEGMVTARVAGGGEEVESMAEGVEEDLGVAGRVPMALQRWVTLATV